MTLATFLAVFALLMARLQTRFPATARPLNGTALLQHRPGVVVTTTPSGRVVESSVPASAAPGTGRSSTAVLTRSSGAAGARDD